MDYCESCEYFKRNERNKGFGFCSNYPEPEMKKHFKTTGVEVHIADEACKNYKPRQIEVIQE